MPVLTVFIFFVLYPVALTLYFSFFKWNGPGGSPTNFVEFENLEKLFADPVFFTALRNNFTLIFFSLALQLPSALILALIIGRRSFRGAIILRAVFFMPYIFSEVLTGVVWRFVYH